MIEDISGQSGFSFQEIDVPNMGHFDADQTITLSNGLTLIMADNGFGKDAIVKLLRVEYSRLNDSNAEYQRFLRKQIFYDQSISLPYSGMPWEPLANMLSSYPECLANLDELQGYVTENIRTMLRGKVQGLSKFGGILRSVDDLDATITPNGTICINSVDSKRSIDRCFHAHGERVVLYLAINFAVRNLFKLKVPFVGERLLSNLESWAGDTCFKFLQDTGEQCILIEGKSICKSLRSKSDYSIMNDLITNRSTIHKRGPSAMESRS